MKKILFLTILIVFLLILLSGCNNQKSTKEQSSVSQEDLNKEYEIREKCGKQSEEWFKSYQQKYPGDKFTYKNHYSDKLNKCFIYITSFQSGGYQTIRLVDVNENKEYGSCLGNMGDEDNFLCKFLDKDVKDKKEWDSFIKPYLEE